VVAAVFFTLSESETEVEKEVEKWWKFRETRDGVGLELSTLTFVNCWSNLKGRLVSTIKREVDFWHMKAPLTGRRDFE